MANTLRSKGRIRNEKGGKFRLITGAHLGDGPPGCVCDGCLESGGKNHVYQGATRTYSGDIIDSKQDLARRFNQGPHSIKFERLSDKTPARSKTFRSGDEDESDTDYKALTVMELRAIAEEREISLDGLTKKSEIIAAIEAADSEPGLSSEDPGDENEDEDDEE